MEAEAGMYYKTHFRSEGQKIGKLPQMGSEFTQVDEKLQEKKFSNL